MVEDLACNRKLAGIILEKLGYCFESAVDGQQALFLCNRKKYGLILMDCQMPVKDGYETTCRIRKEGKNQETPIVAMTAHALKGDLEKCVDSGMNDYLRKPITLEKVKRMITKWYSGYKVL